MNPNKVVAIGVIVLFLGLVMVPGQASIIKKDQQLFPIQFSLVNQDGSIGSRIISLTKNQVTELSDIIERYSKRHDRNDFMNALQLFFKRTGYKDDFDFMKMKRGNIFDILPGCPIFSIGEGREYLTRYHGRIQFKKLISTWHYPDNGFTMIIGNNLSPKQILFQRQMGIMIGFVGLYIYIPKMLEYQKAGITCFAGSALFAWGTSF
jgi:hypothetical protein